MGTTVAFDPPVSCRLNDYNAMFSFGGVYHFTYQDHINCPDDINQANQSFGHVATTDLVHLVHLPPMLTDSPTFDNTLGPWDGPGFICNGVPTVIYNSHAEGNAFSRQTKTAATPTDRTDKWLTNWTRSPLSPSEAFIGPSTLPPPWLSNDGSHYYAFAKPSVGTGCWLWATDADSNCTAWAVVTQNFTDPEFCYTNSPELWPVPRPCPGCPAATAGPTHVLKYTAGEYDAYVLGVYDEQGLRFTPTTDPKLYEFPKVRQFEDGRGAWSESVLTIDGTRRFYISWVPPGVTPGYRGPQNLPAGSPPLWHTSTAMRELFYDPRLEQLTFAPIIEYAKLRGDPIGAPLVAEPLEPGAAPRVLGQGRQFDIALNFTLGPTRMSTFGVTVFASAAGLVGVQIGVTCTNGTEPRLLPGTDLPGDDYYNFGVDPSYTPQECAAACVNDTRCKAWTLVEGIGPPGGKYPPYRCCFKNAIPPTNPNPKCVSGIPAAGPMCTLVVDTTGSGDVPNHTVSSPVATVAAPLLPEERVVSLRVLGDRSIVEVFAVSGRAVATATVYSPAAHSTITLWAGTGDVTVSGEAYAMGCAWIDPVEVASPA